MILCFSANCIPVLVQQNINGSKFFNRSWEEFKVGFNSTFGNYWIGNDLLSQLTLSGRYKLRFELQARDNSSWYWASTAVSLFLESHATTRFTCLATRATPATMHLATTTEWCSPRTTETTTCGPAAATMATVQCTTAEDSGTRDAAIATSTLSVVVEMTSNGTQHCCVHLACGSRARSIIASSAAHQRWVCKCKLIRTQPFETENIYSPD